MLTTKHIKTWLLSLGETVDASTATMSDTEIQTFRGVASFRFGLESERVLDALSYPESVLPTALLHELLGSLSDEQREEALSGSLLSNPPEEVAPEGSTGEDSLTAEDSTEPLEAEEAEETASEAEVEEGEEAVSEAEVAEEEEAVSEAEEAEEGEETGNPGNNATGSED